MGDSIILPGARARLVDSDGKCTAEFYRFFQRVASAKSVQQVTTTVTRIVDMLDGGGAYMPITSNVKGDADVVAAGVLAAGIVSLSLSDTGVTPATYGDGIQLVAFIVDSKGRISKASERALIAGNGISFDIDPDTGAVTISVNSFVANNRVTRDGSTRVTRDGNIRIIR